MKRFFVTASLLCLNLATISAAAKPADPGAAEPAVELEPEEGLVILVDADEAAPDLEILEGLDLEGVRLDPKVLEALRELERNRQHFEDPLVGLTHYQAPAYSSYSSGTSARLAIKILSICIGLVVLFVRAGRQSR
ncbi:MAG: hypothetical protein JXR96_19935 [Deltaproteobacteria bacterium]|nr:hypothetical protein [Deltaproteobacteria bacterium]